MKNKTLVKILLAFLILSLIVYGPLLSCSTKRPSTFVNYTSVPGLRVAVEHISTLPREQISTICLEGHTYYVRGVSGGGLAPKLNDYGKPCHCDSSTTGLSPLPGDSCPDINEKIYKYAEDIPYKYTEI